MLDLERSNALSTVALQDWVKAFLGRVYERTGVRGIIYVSPSFWKTYMGDTTWFAQNDYDVLWIAHWTTAAEPTLPAGGVGRGRLDVLAVHVRWPGPGSTAASTSTATTARISGRT